MPKTTSTRTRSSASKSKSTNGASASSNGTGAGRLVIVESPAKARTISKYLGRGYTVKASMGHVRDLPKSTLGVEVDDDFAPKYLVPRDKVKVVKDLKASVQNAREVILATDPDREGEAIAWHLIQATEANAKPVRRVVFHEITPEAVTEAMENPREIDMDLVEAQQARRVLDRLVGYGVSPLLWKKVKRGLSAGACSRRPYGWSSSESGRSKRSSLSNTGRLTPNWQSRPARNQEARHLPSWSLASSGQKGGSEDWRADPSCGRWTERRDLSCAHGDQA